ncbi:hypothetical protein NODU109028_09535 [Nocardioides dubius]|uniref:Uncharacterized protein n=1 Tax=Nocardioides dubius TaxID=317019 RepID=A0ABP4EPT6_9ACTN
MGVDSCLVNVWPVAAVLIRLGAIGAGIGTVLLVWLALNGDAWLNERPQPAANLIEAGILSGARCLRAWIGSAARIGDTVT